MLCRSSRDMPSSLEGVLPQHALKVYYKTFHNTYRLYHETEDTIEPEKIEHTARRVAWSAVKKKFHKSAKGRWKKMN